MFEKLPSATTKTGHGAAADHCKLADIDEAGSLCPWDNLAETTAPLFRYQDGSVLPFSFSFESALSQQVNGPHSTPLEALCPWFIVPPDKLTRTRSPL